MYKICCKWITKISLPTYIPYGTVFFVFLLFLPGLTQIRPTNKKTSIWCSFDSKQTKSSIEPSRKL